MSKKIEIKVNAIFINSIKNIKSPVEVVNFLNDLLSPAEQTMLAKRIAIAFMLLENKYTYQDIMQTLKVSNGTVAKINSILVLKGSGFKKTLRNLITHKMIKNNLSEFLDLLIPKRRTLTGEIYNKPFVDRNKEKQEPL